MVQSFELSLVHIFTVWMAKASRFQSGIIHHETGVFWPLLSLIYGDARGYKNHENIARALSRNAQLLHIHSLSSAFRGKLRPVSDHVRICCGCVSASTIIYGFLRSVSVDYRRNEIFEPVKNRATEKSRWRKHAG